MKGARVLGALALLGAAAWVPAAEGPVYVRRLVLPVADDAIGYPPGVTADPHTGEVFVCDSRLNRVIVFDPEGLFLYEMPGGDAFTGPQDVAVDPEGLLVVAASHELRPAVVELDFDGLFRREVRLSGLPEEVAEGEMPPWSYRLAHPEARLSGADRAALEAWGRSLGGGETPASQR